MDELIRDGLHEALDVEPPPPWLRARVMASLPSTERGSARAHAGPRAEWAASFVAVLLAVAIVASLIYIRALTHAPVPVHPKSPSAVSLLSPEGVAVGPDGSVYVSDFLSDLVFRLRPDGKVLVAAGGGFAGDGPALKAHLNHPAGIAIDRNGNLFIADVQGGTIRRVDARGSISTVVLRSATGGNVSLNAPMGLTFDSAGNLWVGELGGPIVRVDPSGVASTIDTSALPPPQWVPGYAASDASGGVYISDRAPGMANNPLYSSPPGGGCRIMRVAPDGRPSVIAGTGVCGFSGDGGPATRAQLDDPNGLAFDAAGNLYFSDANNHRIRRIDRAGVITTVAGTGVAGSIGDGGPATQAELQYPFGMAISRAGLLYFSDMSCQCWDPQAAGKLRAISLSTGSITTVMDGETPILN